MFFDGKASARLSEEWEKVHNYNCPKKAAEIRTAFVVLAFAALLFLSLGSLSHNPRLYVVAYIFGFCGAFFFLGYLSTLAADIRFWLDCRKLNAAIQVPQLLHWDDMKRVAESRLECLIEGVTGCNDDRPNIRRNWRQIIKHHDACRRFGLVHEDLNLWFKIIWDRAKRAKAADSEVPASAPAASV
jgi:hypothetical protein